MLELSIAQEHEEETERLAQECDKEKKKRVKRFMDLLKTGDNS